jgi:hypothetical protein
MSLDRLPAEGCHVNVDASSLLRKTRKSLFICEYFGATNGAVAVKMLNANCPFSGTLFDSSIQSSVFFYYIAIRFFRMIIQNRSGDVGCLSGKRSLRNCFSVEESIDESIECLYLISFKKTYLITLEKRMN